jgi:hypothetical protein
MLHIEFTPEQVETLHHERFHHPHPRVQLKMEAVYLKSQGLPHHEICRLVRISENTLRTYLRQFQEGASSGSSGSTGPGPRANWTSTAEPWRPTSASTRPAPPARSPPRSSGSPASAGA